MKINRPQHRYLLPSLFLACGLFAALAPGLASAAEEDVAMNDPQRWYQGDDTPQLHYRNLLKEAQAAQGQAMQDCKALKGAAAQSCRKDARHQYAEDKARAKRILKLLDQQQE